MSRFFNPDNPIMEFIAKIFDLILLNLIFIFSCVPIITIGASTSALSYVTLKMVRGEDPYIWQNFWKSFRQNFKQGTLIWVFSILVFIFLGMDFYIINSEYSTVCSDTHSPLVCMSSCIICILICLSGHLTFCVQYSTGIKKCSFYDIRTPAVYTGNVGDHRTDPVLMRLLC